MRYINTYNKFEADSSIRQKLIRGSHTQDGSDLYVYAKFEADSSIRSKVMRGPIISKLGHVTLNHAHFER